MTVLALVAKGTALCIMYMPVVQLINTILGERRALWGSPEAQYMVIGWPCGTAYKLEGSWGWGLNVQSKGAACTAAHYLEPLVYEQHAVSSL